MKMEKNKQERPMIRVRDVESINKLDPPMQEEVPTLNDLMRISSEEFLPAIGQESRSTVIQPPPPAYSSIPLQLHQTPPGSIIINAYGPPNQYVVANPVSVNEGATASYDRQNTIFYSGPNVTLHYPVVSQPMYATQNVAPAVAPMSTTQHQSYPVPGNYSPYRASQPSVVPSPAQYSSTKSFADLLDPKIINGAPTQTLVKDKVSNHFRRVKVTEPRLSPKRPVNTQSSAVDCDIEMGGLCRIENVCSLAEPQSQCAKNQAQVGLPQSSPLIEESQERILQVPGKPSLVEYQKENLIAPSKSWGINLPNGALAHINVPPISNPPAAPSMPPPPVATYSRKPRSKAAVTKKKPIIAPVSDFMIRATLKQCETLPVKGGDAVTPANNPQGKQQGPLPVPIQTYGRKCPEKKRTETTNPRNDFVEPAPEGDGVRLQNKLRKLFGVTPEQTDSARKEPNVARKRSISQTGKKVNHKKTLSHIKELDKIESCKVALIPLSKEEIKKWQKTSTDVFVNDRGSGDKKPVALSSSKPTENDGSDGSITPPLLLTPTQIKTDLSPPPTPPIPEAIKRNTSPAPKISPNASIPPKTTAVAAKVKVPQVPKPSAARRTPTPPRADTPPALSPSPTVLDSQASSNDNLTSLLESFKDQEIFLCEQCGKTLKTDRFWVNIVSYELNCQYCLASSTGLTRTVLSDGIEPLLDGVKAITRYDSDSDIDDLDFSAKKDALQQFGKTLKENERKRVFILESTGGKSNKKRSRKFVIASSDESDI